MMGIKEQWDMEDRLRLVSEELQRISNEFHVTMGGEIEISTMEPNHDERTIIWQGYKFKPKEQ